MRDKYDSSECRHAVCGLKIRFFAVFLFLSLSAEGYLFAAGADDASNMAVWDGMENKSAWESSVTSKISVSSEYATEGRLSLEVSGNNIPSSGVTVAKKNTYLDLSFAKKIVFDVYNSGAPCKVAIAVYAGQRYESIPKEIQSGLNKNVTFEFNAQDFTFILTAETVAQSVEFIIYPQGDELEPLYIDNVRVNQYGGLQSLPPGISPTMSAAIAEGFTPIEITPLYTGAYRIITFPHMPLNPINEPGTLFLLGTGFLGLILFKKKSIKR